MATKKQKKQEIGVKVAAVGRRREATAIATVTAGNGTMLVNGMPVEKYFSDIHLRAALGRPFEVTETVGKYSVSVRVSGGGEAGQLGAVVMAIARALVKLNEGFRAPLRKAGLLTRDSRTRERRKVGTGGKARRQKQSPKR